MSCYLKQALCSPPGEEEPLLVEVEDGGLQLPGAQIHDPEEVEPGTGTITHFQPLSHTIRSKDGILEGEKIKNFTSRVKLKEKIATFSSKINEKLRTRDILSSLDSSIHKHYIYKVSSHIKRKESTYRY